MSVGDKMTRHELRDQTFKMLFGMGFHEGEDREAPLYNYLNETCEFELSEEEQKEAIKDFALTKGLLVALLAGVMSACFALGLSSGAPLASEQSAALFRTLPATLMVTIGGFLTNAVYCIYQNVKNKTFGDYTNKAVWVNNVLFCALAGVLWYSQFFGLGIGSSFFVKDSVIAAFAWCILMSLNVVFSNVWGILLKEWKGVSAGTVVVLVLGLLVLIFSLIFPNLFNM